MTISALGEQNQRHGNHIYDEDATVTGSSNGTTTQEVTDDGTAQVEIKIHPHLSLTKMIDKTELRDDDAKVGSLLDYSFTVTNDGDVELPNASIDDHLDGISDVNIDWASSTDASTGNGVLSAGESVTATATYAITQSDIDTGKVVNTAVSNGTTQSGQDVQSNEATAETVITAPEPEPTPEEPDDDKEQENPPAETPDDTDETPTTDEPDDADTDVSDDADKPNESVNDTNDANDTDNENKTNDAINAGETDNADIGDSGNMDDPSDNQTGEPIVSTGVSMAATVIALVASAIISTIIIVRKIRK